MWFGGGETTIYRVPKKASKNLSKNLKKVLTKCFSGGIIVKLSGARATQTAAENRITTAFEGISRASAPEKTSKNLKKVLDKRNFMRYNK